MTSYCGTAPAWAHAQDAMLQCTWPIPRLNNRKKWPRPIRACDGFLGVRVSFQRLKQSTFVAKNTFWAFDYMVSETIWTSKIAPNASLGASAGPYLQDVHITKFWTSGAEWRPKFDMRGNVHFFKGLINLRSDYPRVYFFSILCPQTFSVQLIRHLCHRYDEFYALNHNAFISMLLERKFDSQRSSGTLRYMRLGWGKIPPGYPCRASLGPVFWLRNSTVLTGNDSSIVKNIHYRRWCAFRMVVGLVIYIPIFW